MVHTDLAAVDPCPELVIWLLPEAEDTADPLRQVHSLTRDVLARLQSWLARPDTAHARLLVVTRNAVSVSAFDGVPDLAHAAAWALIHTAQNEHPDRIVLLDTDNTAASQDNLLAIAATRPAGEPQLALRNGVAHIPRLARPLTLTPPDAPDWQLASTGRGDLGNLTLVPTNPPDTLAPGQIRVQIRAAGLNFHDVVVALGAIADREHGQRGRRDRPRGRAREFAASRGCGDGLCSRTTRSRRPRSPTSGWWCRSRTGGRSPRPRRRRWRF